MPEPKERYESWGKLLVACIFAMLYAYGGEEYKWIRRFLAPAFLCSSMFYFSRDWRSLVQMPLMMATLSMGYGGDTFGEILKRRATFAIANAFSSSAYQIILFKNWSLILLNFILITSSVLLLGVFNQLPNARHEELAIGFLIAFIPIISAKKLK